ncbi:DUF5667 domain-containing protein [Chloroflexota bacterium]
MKTSSNFNNILDDCITRLLVRGETVEQCLLSYPEDADALKPLLDAALAAKELSVIQPRPEFRDRARYEFRLVLQEMERKRRRPFFAWSWQPRWATVVAVVLAVLLAGSGTVAAASGSMPDEPLYSVKLATEQVQLTLTPYALDKAELYAEFADKRVIEIVRMTDENKPEKIEQIASNLDVYLAKIVDLVSTQGGRGDVAMAPAPKAAPAVRETLVAPEWAKGGGGAPQLGTDNRANLRATVARNAASNTARLRAVLEKAPESAKPALLRAIAVTETGYKKALETLE